MEILILFIFLAGYLVIALEHFVHINKAATAILTGVLCWSVFIISQNDSVLINHDLAEHLGQISGILFFLLGAMTIVELIDSHDGFRIITNRIETRNKKKLLLIVVFFTFFLSSALDNLTTAIVMTTLCRKLVSDRNERMLFLGMVIIAANAGGAWSPIGDVTTTMLWIGGQITTTNIMVKLFLPSIVCTVVPYFMVSYRLKGNVETDQKEPVKSRISDSESTLVLVAGLSALIFVPVFKTLTDLPPYMGILFGLSILWVITGFLHSSKTHEVKSSHSVQAALQKIDTSSILFFLGILIAIAALESTGMLEQMATFLSNSISSENVIVMSLGLLSSVIDNVPLVAAAMGMYDLTTYPPDHYFWEFLAYCCGTGGSVLIIGSAAGVAVMGMEKIEFIWYLRKIALYALAGYFAGAFLYILMEPLFG